MVPRESPLFSFFDTTGATALMVVAHTTRDKSMQARQLHVLRKPPRAHVVPTPSTISDRSIAGTAN